MPSCRGAPRRHPPSTQRVASHNDGRSRPAGGRAARSRRPSGRALSTASQEHLSRLLESESVLQRTRAWLVYAGLTLPLALLALVAGTAFTVALGTLRRGTRAERRLRAALLRRALPSGARLAIAGGL